MLTDTLKPALKERKKLHLFRERKIISKKQNTQFKLNNQYYLSFSSNDYLGLSQHPKIIEAAQKAIIKYGVGSAGSNVLSGHTVLHEALENKLAAFLGLEKVILLPSGYHANVAAVSTLLGPNEVILADHEIHASLIDGCRLSKAKLRRYRHNSISHLSKILKDATQCAKWILTDSLFSSSGDIASLPEIIKLTKQYQLNLLLDDAHGIGCLGENGRGLIEYQQIHPNDITLLTGSFAKAFGTNGGFIAGKKEIIEYLIQFARPYIYSNALTPTVTAATLSSLNIIITEKHRRIYLNSLINYFRHNAKQFNIPIEPSFTPIQAIIIGNSKKTQGIATKLLEKKILVSTMRPPSVPQNTDRLRISLNVNHTHKEIDYLLEKLAKILKNV